MAPQRVYDVIVSGAGPAGIVAGVALQAAGLDFLVLEAGPTLQSDLRASTFHAPTLDYLETLGLTQKLIPQGLISPEYRFFNRRTGECLGFDLSELADFSTHPFRLQCEQWKMMNTGAALLGEQLLLGHQVTGAKQDGAGVTLYAQTPNGTHSFRARYVVACDGANSVLRKALDVEFSGFTYEEKFLCLSTTTKMQERLPDICNVNYMADPEKWFVLLQAPTAWRVLVSAPVDVSDADLLGDAKKNAVFADLLGTDETIDALHRTIYRVHQRVAKKYVLGRVILAGDAAHLNNPIGGFGMNSAIHDVRNLTEKLTGVLKEGKEDVSNLALYERQRRTVMEEFIQIQSIRNKLLMEMSKEQSFESSSGELRQAAEDPVKRREFLMKQSMYSSVAREMSIK